MGSILILCLLAVFASKECCAQNASAAEHASKGIALAKSRQWPEAERELRAAVFADPKMAVYYAQLGSVLGLQEKWKEALESFEKSVELDPQNVNFRRETAAVQWQLRRLDPAEKNLKYILQSHPGDPGATLLLGLVVEAHGDFATATKLLSSQFELVAAQPERVSSLFHSAFQSGDEENIEKTVEVLRSHESEATWTNTIGRCLQVALLGGDIETSQTLFQMISVENPKRAEIGLEVARLQYQKGKITDAQELLLKLAEHDDGSADVYALLGNCYESQHQFQSALQAYQRAIELDPSQIVHYGDLISLELDLGRTDAAMDLANRARNFAPKDARAWVWKGNVELRTNAFQDAQPSFLRARELDSTNPDATLGLAGAKALAGSNEEAISEYKNGIARFPKDARFYMACAAMYSAMPSALELQSQTENLLEQAIKLEPQSAEAHYQSGQLAVQQGKLQKAESELVTSIKSDASKSKTHFVLSGVYRRQGRSEDAAKEFAIYQKLKSEEENETPMAATPVDKP